MSGISQKKLIEDFSLKALTLSEVNRALIRIGLLLSQMSGVGQNSDMHGSQITNVGTPAKSTDAVNKGVLDSGLSVKADAPSASTDNAIVRIDGTVKLQGSSATLDDYGSINIPSGQTYKINGSPHSHTLGGLSDVSDVTTEQGDSIYFDGSGWVFLNHGAAGQALITGGHGANPAWGDPANADKVDGKHAADLVLATEKGAASGVATLSASSLVPTGQLGTGTANNTTFLRGDNTWATPTGAETSFNDAEGDPAAIGTAADGTSSYAARRDHVHACADATTSAKGISSFSSTYFSVSSGAVSLVAAYQKATASGVASLDGSSLVVQNPANATATATASKIPIADGSGKLDTWISDATTAAKGKASFSSTYFAVSSGEVTIKAAGVPYARIQNVSATDRILGRVSSGAGTIEEITCTSAGRAILDDATAADQCTTLGLGTASTVQFAKLGLGAANSQGTLHITATSAGNVTTGQVLQNANDAAGTGIGVNFVAYTDAATPTAKIIHKYDPTASYLITLGCFNTFDTLNITNARVGIKISNPSYDLSFEGNAARYLGLERNTTSNTAGSAFQIQGGGATLGATNKAGGHIYIVPGIPTGNAESGVKIYGGGGGSPGTADGNYYGGIEVLSSKIGFWGLTPAAKQTLAAYTADAESSAYTTTGAGADIASKTDLNALRTAYETLRAMCEDLRTKITNTTLCVLP